MSSFRLIAAARYRKILAPRAVSWCAPHDHGPSWAVYSQVAGVTEMTGWRLVEKPADGQPGKVEKVRTCKLTPGTAHLYNEGDLHPSQRDDDTRLVRIEGTDLTKVKRHKFEIAGRPTIA